MKTNYLTRISLVCLLCISAVITGCCINIGCWPRAKYEKTEQLSAPFAPGQTLDVQTNVGSITVTGADVSTCDVTATITAKARTTEKARKLAEETKIKLESTGDKLKVKVKKPPMADKDAICVSFDITVPKQTELQLASNVGEIHVSNITEPIEAETNVGTITCREITGHVDLTTNVGEVTVAYSDTAPSACNADIKIDIGEINFTAPPDLSAHVNVSANIGSIETTRSSRISLSSPARLISREKPAWFRNR